MKKHILITCCFLLSIVTTLAENNNIYFCHFDKDAGLSSSLVTSIVQDKKGSMWLGTNYGLNRYNGSRNTIFTNNPSDSNSLPGNSINCLAIDDEGRLWVGTTLGLAVFIEERNCFERITSLSDRIEAIGVNNDGNLTISSRGDNLFILNPDTHELTELPYKELGIMELSPRAILTDHDGTLWLGDFSKGLFYLGKDRTIRVFNDPDTGENPFSNDSIYDIIEDDNGDLLIASIKAGLTRINKKTKAISRLLEKEFPDEEMMCYCVSIDPEGRIVCGGEKGLLISNHETGKWDLCYRSITDKASISGNAIHAAFFDRDGGLWLGTNFGGVSYSLVPFSPIDMYYVSKQGIDMHGEIIHELCMDDEGYIWISTEDDGLNVFNPKTNTFTFIEESRDFHSARGLMMKEGKLWVSSFGDGIRIIDPRTRRVIKSFKKDVNCPSLVSNFVYDIECDACGDIYIATSFGMQKYNPAGDFFENVDCTDKVIRSMYRDNNGNLWAITRASGYYRKDSATGQWRYFCSNVEHPSSLEGDILSAIYQDSKGRIWLMSKGAGLGLYDEEDDSVRRFTKRSGLPDNRLYTMQEGKDGRLWISTESEMVVFDPETEDMEIITSSDGLFSNIFNFRSSLQDEDGRMYFGGLSGLVCFNPRDIHLSKNKPSAYISEIKVNGNNILVDSSGSHLKANENNLEISVEAITMHCSLDYTLEYKLEDADNQWTILKGSETLNYHKLNHGKYNFSIRVRSHDGEISELQSYNFSIAPHWYQTTLAYIMYFILVLLIVYLSTIIIREMTKNEYKAKMADMKSRQEQEIYDSKMSFYTEVAHEIRTPLTLIYGPLKDIVRKDISDPEMVEDIRIMKQSTEKLLNLVNHLLDFRKYEAGGFELKYSSENICAIVKDVCKNFSQQVRQNNLALSVECPDEDIVADIDYECFIKMITNLVSNSCKYSESYVRISIERDADSAVIRTINDGELIPEDRRESVFEAFTRNRSRSAKPQAGTGIGLVLTKSLTELHGGSIIVEPSDSENIFRLTLPLKHEAAARNTETAISEIADDSARILIVEDEVDVNNYLKNKISKKHGVIQAYDGDDALRILETTDVNVIISDISMPVMDGLELCRKIKKDIRYSHIPFILLTARTNIQPKIEAMESGADSYIEKPFSPDFVTATIDNLLLKQKRIQEQYQKGRLTVVATNEASPADHEFIEKLRGIIADNYADPDFKLDEVYGRMNMSKSNFYRKMKGAMNMTPSDLLRVERLNKASELLATGKYRINEVCYMVGFSSPSYFTNCFQKQFGKSPKEFSVSAF